MGTNQKWFQDNALSEMLAAGWQPCETDYPGYAIAWPSACIDRGHLASPTLQGVVAGHRCDACRIEKRRERRKADAAIKQAEGRRKKLEHDLGVDHEYRTAGFIPLEPVKPSGSPRKCWCVGCKAIRYKGLGSIRNGHACKFCDARQRAAWKSQTDAQRIIEAAGGKNPVGDYLGARTLWPFHCATCNFLVDSVAFNTVQQNLWSCSNCKRLHRLAKWIKHVVTHGWMLLEYPSEINGKWRMRHRCGLEHNVRPAAIGRFAEGCPKCAAGAFDVSKLGWLYLLWIPEHGALKVGVTNHPDQRYAQHRRYFEFEEVLLIGARDGHLVKNVEDQILRDWKPLGYAPSIAEARIPGWTETVPLHLVAVDDIVGRIRSFFDAPIFLAA